MSAEPAPRGVNSPAGPVSATTDGRTATAGGEIERLNPYDGLFLRAEHLTVMQDYARALARAVGSATGPGVVEGFDVSVTDDCIRIGPGLAFDREGFPLWSGVAAEIPCPGPQEDGNFLVVEATAASWVFGDEPVQALLCDTPRGSRGRPYEAEGVEVRCVVRSMKEFSQAWPADPRGWLASRLFDAEATAAEAWPRGSGAGTSLTGVSWRPPGLGDRPSGGLPLAVLIPVGDRCQDWRVDHWCVRRDRGHPRPEDTWRWRTAMRPWNVFVAQVLQFQDHLATEYLPGPAGTARLSTAEILRSLKEVGAPQRGQRTAKRHQEIGAAFERLVADAAAAEPPTLSDVGIIDLPPAGLLPVQGQAGQAVITEVERLTGGRIGVRHAGTCTLGDVGRLIEEAQHRTRVPLDPPSGVQVGIDVYIPTDDGQRSTDWVVFQSRDGREHVPGTEPVRVYTVAAADPDEAGGTVATVLAGTFDWEGLPHVELRYPTGTWAVPRGTTEGEPADLLQQIAGLPADRLVAVAVVRSEERRALGLVRAGLLTTSERQDGFSMAELRSAVHPPAATGEPIPEAVVVVASPSVELQ